VAVRTDAELLTMAKLGRTPQGAIARLVREFHYRGWRDDGQSAVAMVQVLLDCDGVAPVRTVAAAAPRDFLVRNGVRRADLQNLLRRLA
jgi:hypothetical protein